MLFDFAQYRKKSQNKCEGFETFASNLTLVEYLSTSGVPLRCKRWDVKDVMTSSHDGMGKRRGVKHTISEHLLFSLDLILMLVVV